MEVGQGWVDHKGWCTENRRRIVACYWMKHELYEEWHCDLNVLELHRWHASCVCVMVKTNGTDGRVNGLMEGWSDVWIGCRCARGCSEWRD